MSASVFEVAPVPAVTSEPPVTSIEVPTSRTVDERIAPFLSLWDGFFNRAQQADYLQYFLHQHPWPTNHYSVAGRSFQLPRQQTWHADPGIVYSYTDNLLTSQPWNALLLQIRRALEAKLNYPFNAVLVNLYRDGSDYVGWHSDDDREMGTEPLIASVTFGATRGFQYRSSATGEVGELELNSGSLLVMHPEFQRHFQHGVPPAPEIHQPRINLTFRRVLPPPAK
ncbi:alpha-ketoglutarate-dependent dioxygenase AlkB [Halioxenophilus sp. WMMB6]|uniref:alpha-ketoglutarate-dependent dioxygenase AlkB family protein n=1 Tax=Halioxenophilus sp. WMMB6 TaxID=3073815 RepID=UPI00295F52DF|nr:alpha-ketoglutarate-dependent dioxygenase AlkB [Halioxenophilus sp. WMMB6]